MTKQPPLPHSKSAQKKQKQLERQMSRYGDLIEDLIYRAEAGEFGALSETTRLRTQLLSTLKNFQDGEIALARDRLTQQGIRSESDIDFDAVRREVGGRLDRLRNAARADDLSRGAK